MAEDDPAFCATPPFHRLDEPWHPCGVSQVSEAAQLLSDQWVAFWKPYWGLRRDPGPYNSRSPPQLVGDSLSTGPDYEALVQWLVTHVTNDSANKDANTVCVITDTEPLPTYAHWQHTARVFGRDL